MTALSWASQPARFARAGATGPAEPNHPLRVAGCSDPGRDETRPDGPGPGADLAEVVGPFVGLMTRTSRRILHDDDLADDAIQETLLTYWARPEQPANPRAWLLHAVTLRSLHLARSARRRREHERRASLNRSEWSLRDDPTGSLDHAEFVETLHEALGRLPAEYRAVFLLWAFDEMDYAGIASTLQIPVGTVRSRLNRTRRLIRESLARLGIDPGRPTGPPRATPDSA